MCCGTKASNPMQRVSSVPNPTAIKDKQKRGSEPPAEVVAENNPQPAGEVMPTDQPAEISADRAEPAPSNTKKASR